MAKKRVVRESGRTPDQVASEQAIRDRFQTSRPSLASLVESGEYTAPVKQGEYLTLMAFASLVKSIREEKALSLTEIANRTGIDKASLSRLENGLLENPTIGTLMRVAKSLGKRLRIELEDETPVAGR